jgi:aryl-alcohol dehydrogenase-like predicted oxidoreductase
MDYGIQRAGQPKLPDVLAMLDYAVQNGINAIDTAAAYGTAEEVVGEFFRKHPNVRGKVELISKLSPNAADVRESLLQSLRKLGTDYLDGYLLHNPAHMSDDAIVDAMLRLKQEGLVKSIGASVYTPYEAKKGIERGLDMLQIPYSVFDQRMDEQGVLNLAQSKSVKLHSRSAFTQGLMLMDEAEIPPHLEKAKPIVRKLAMFCAEYNISRLQLAIAFVGRNENITHLVFGADRLGQVQEIIEAHRQSVAEDVLKEAAHQFARLDEEIVVPSKWGK